ncbi:lipopolysaccharide biosynthesis protein [Aeromonas veronii]
MKSKSIIHFAVGLILSAIVNVITLPIMAWLYPKEIIGKLAMLNVAVAFSVTLFTLGLDQAFVREYHESKNKIKVFFEAILPGFILLFATILTVNFLDENIISNIIFTENSRQLSLIVSAMIIVSYLNRYLSLIFRMQEKGIIFSLSQALPKLLFLFLVVVLFIFHYDSLELLMLSQAASVFLITIASIYFAKEFFFTIPKIQKNNIIYMLKYSLPLLIGAMSYWGLSTIDRIYIAKFSTYSELAVFSIAMSFAGAANVIQSIFSTVWVPTVYKWVNEIDSVSDCQEKIESVKNIVSYISFLVISITAVFSWLLLYFLPNDYSDVVYIIPSCMICALYYTISETTVVGLSIVRKTMYSMISSLSAFLVNCIANLFMVPILGAKGAAISTSFSFLIFLILRTEFSSFHWLKIKRVRLYCNSTGCLLMTTLFCIYGKGNQELFIFGWLVFFGIINASYFSVLKTAYVNFKL